MRAKGAKIKHGKYFIVIQAELSACTVRNKLDLEVNHYN